MAPHPEWTGHQRASLRLQAFRVPLPRIRKGAQCRQDQVSGGRSEMPGVRCPWRAFAIRMTARLLRGFASRPHRALRCREAAAFGTLLAVRGPGRPLDPRPAGGARPAFGPERFPGMSLAHSGGRKIPAGWIRGEANCGAFDHMPGASPIIWVRTGPGLDRDRNLKTGSFETGGRDPVSLAS